MKWPDFSGVKKWRLPVLCVILLLSTGNADHQGRQAVYSVPAHQFMQLLARNGIEPATRLQNADQRWTQIDPSSAQSLCQLRGNGEFVARQVSTPPLPRQCEWTLFRPGYTLRPGWLIQRLHWKGHTSLARFDHHPIRTEKAYLRVRLPLSAESDTRLSLHLVTLLGPEGARPGDAIRQGSRSQGGNASTAGAQND